MTQPLCAKCNKPFVKNSNAQKYCKHCKIAVALQQNRECKKKERKKMEGNFSSHMKRDAKGRPDFESERKDIDKYMKSLGLRK